MRDSYVVLKDSRMFISSRTAVSSVDNSAVSSSRSAVSGCETERGKRHVYLKKTECIFSDPHVHIVDAGRYLHMYADTKEKKPESLRHWSLQTLKGQRRVFYCTTKCSERSDSAISSSAI